MEEKEPEIQEFKIEETHSTECNHEYQEMAVIDGHKEVTCVKCWHGVQIDPAVVVKDGRILWNK